MFTVELWLFRCSIQVNEYSDLMCEFEKPFLINLQGGLSCLPLLCGFYARANAFSGVTNGSISRTLIGYAECFTSQQLGEWAVKHIWFNFVSSSEHCEAWRKGWGWEKSRERARNGEGGYDSRDPDWRHRVEAAVFMAPDCRLGKRLWWNNMWGKGAVILSEVIAPTGERALQSFHFIACFVQHFSFILF